MPLSVKEISFLVMLYFKIKPVDSRQIRRQFKKKFGHTNFDMKSVRRWAKKFIEKGSVKKEKPKGRPRTKRTPDIIHEVKKQFIIQGENSITNVHLELQKQNIKISRTTVGRIAKESKFKPYKFEFGQELKQLDFPARVTFCTWFLQKCVESEFFIFDVITSDESYFYLTKRFNKQNHRYWNIKKPDYKIPTPQHPKNLHVWVAMSCRGIIGPFFVRNGTLNSEKYCVMLKDQFFVMLDQYEIDVSSWFMIICKKNYHFLIY